MKKTFQNRWLIIAVIVLCFLSEACSKRKTVLDSVVLDAEILPLMHTEENSSLISDSGLTRYRLVAKVWDIHDNSHQDRSYWYFPEGFYVEQFDSIFNVEGSIKSDTAYYFDKKSLWRLVGNVEALNLQKVKIETQELFWNEKLKKIYSDQAVTIEESDRIIMGEGFESNQEMTDYNIFKIKGIMYILENDSILKNEE